MLSLVIPTYNCEKYIEECLHSVLSQLPLNCELILVDDGSSDATCSVLETFRNAHKNLTIIKKEHKGASAARNAGLLAARGEFVSFIDCDDCLEEGFLEKSLPLTKSGADLYIFGIERILLSGKREYWTVNDRTYPDVSDFADDYIRVCKLLVYSNCNKFYRTSVIRKQRVCFDESSAFGEDRLFNFHFLEGCGMVVSSVSIMLKYIQRSADSLSGQHIPGYFDIIKKLHKAKMNCFLSLSKGTTSDEKRDFRAYDVSREVELTIERFKDHPEEVEENLPKINQLIFGGPYDMDIPVDILIVLGSSNCEYRVKKALELGRKNPGMQYIVSGGNPHLSGDKTEAEFMAEYLRMHGVPEKEIFLENRAQFTYQNLEFSAGIVKRIRSDTGLKRNVGIVTAGFHLRRTRMLAESMCAYSGESLYYFPTYGPHTALDHWYKDEYGKAIVLAELRKFVRTGYADGF